METTTNQYKEKGALDAFLNLFSLIALGWMSISLGQLLFLIIDKFFNSQLGEFSRHFSQTSLKFSVASLIIITPIFLLVVGSLHKYYKNHILNSNSGIYRWLTYLMLLISALNIIGSLIAVIFKLLDGDYALSSILKIAAVFIIALGIFGYYWQDLKRYDYSRRSMISFISVMAVIAVVLVSVVSSFFLVDSPAVSRMKKFDNEKVDDLSNLDALIGNHYRNNKKLPADLSDKKFDRFRDPETNELYKYNVLDDKEYELCASFNLSSDKDEKYFFNGQDWYYHGAGYQCFNRLIKAEEISNPIPVR